MVRGNLEDGEWSNREVWNSGCERPVPCNINGMAIEDLDVDIK